MIRFINPFCMAYVVELVLSKNGGRNILYYKKIFLGGMGPGSYYFPLLMQLVFVLPIILFSMYEKPRGGLVFWFGFNAFYELIKTIVGLDQDIYRLSILRYTFLVAFGCFICLSQRESAINKGYLRIAFCVGFLFILMTKYFGYHTRIINDDWRGSSFFAALYIAPLVFGIIYRF